MAEESFYGKYRSSACCQLYIEIVLLDRSIYICNLLATLPAAGIFIQGCDSVHVYMHIHTRTHMHRSTNLNAYVNVKYLKIFIF